MCGFVWELFAPSAPCGLLRTALAAAFLWNCQFTSPSSATQPRSTVTLIREAGTSFAFDPAGYPEKTWISFTSNTLTVSTRKVDVTTPRVAARPTPSVPPVAVMP